MMVIWKLNLSFIEYIVVFNGYFSSSTRDEFVLAALDSSSVDSWKIIPRHNPASDYPSDFSLVKVSSQTQLKFKNSGQVYLGFIIWGRSSEWAKATSFLGGWGHAPLEMF